LSEKDLYGEELEKFVPPEVVQQARAVLEFCLARYGTDGRQPPKLRWMRKDKCLHGLSVLKDVAEKNVELRGGPKSERLERGHTEEDPEFDLRGYVRMRLSGEKGKSIFINADTTPRRVIETVAHEFYHWRFSPDERRADEFGKRIEREMAEVARREAEEKWIAEFREIQSRKK